MVRARFGFPIEGRTYDRTGKEEREMILLTGIKDYKIYNIHNEYHNKNHHIDSEHIV